MRCARWIYFSVLLVLLSINLKHLSLKILSDNSKEIKLIHRRSKLIINPTHEGQKNVIIW
jgi:hypothetical protein